MAKDPRSDTPPAAPADGPLPLERRLRQALRQAGSALADAPLQRLSDTGLAHDHVRLWGTGWLARVPKQSQLDLPAAENLDYQRHCFERASASGHTPRLHGVLPTSSLLPRGALLVEYVAGRPVRLPQDLPALAQALASLHRLPVPARQAPLMAPADPLADLLAEVDRQAAFLDGPLDPVTRQAIEAERRALQPLLAQPQRPPVCLVSFDAHPGNFVVKADGQAVLVDLEKCRYGHAGVDLAHATLYTSTTWDESARATLSDAEVQAFIETWERAMGPVAQACRPWHLPLRRAMWLWSVTWCAKWRVLSTRDPAADGEDWSSRHSREALVAHVRERVDHYLDPVVVASVRDGLHRLDQALGA